MSASITSPQRLRDARGETHEYVVSLTDKQACALRYIAHERVIRCCDCQYWATEARFTGGCTGRKLDPNGFCAWGKPKEADE